jgi:hypothetical protein
MSRPFPLKCSGAIVITIEMRIHVPVAEGTRRPAPPSPGLLQDELLLHRESAKTRTTGWAAAARLRCAQINERGNRGLIAGSICDR